MATKKQTLEDERKARIFDPKTRMMGVDVKALESQLQEKANLAGLQRDRDEYFNSQTVLMDQHALYLSQQNEAARAQGAADVEAYRKQFQRKHAAREWDLNDPNAKRTDLPGRIGDEDPRCGASSMQKFEGEDLTKAQRLHNQALQMRDWTEQQLEQKSFKQWQESEADRRFGERQEEIAQRAHAMDVEARNQRTAQAKATAEFNRALAKQKQDESMRSKKQETMNNFEEIRNALDSDLLTENPNATLNVNDPYRFKRYHMKGLTPEHRQAILNEQAAQREEMRQRKLKEAEDEREWALAAEKTNTLFGMVEEERRQMRANALKKLTQEWEQQANEASAKKAQDTTQARNAVGEEFFGKFNQSTR